MLLNKCIQIIFFFIMSPFIYLICFKIEDNFWKEGCLCKTVQWQLSSFYFKFFSVLVGHLVKFSLFMSSCCLLLSLISTLLSLMITPFLSYSDVSIHYIPHLILLSIIHCYIITSIYSTILAYSSVLSLVYLMNRTPTFQFAQSTVIILIGQSST